MRETFERRAIMAEYFERTHELGKEGLPGDGAVHKKILYEIYVMINKLDDRRLNIVYRFIKRLCD